jgi:transcriptional regulator with XRE-family HTH domain
VKDLLALFGKRIRTLREDRGWSQEEFAYQCGLHRTYISHVELGKKNISFENIVTISATLGCTLSDLFSGLEDGTAIATRQTGMTRTEPTESAADRQKLPADVNRLVTELRVQRLTMDRVLIALHDLMSKSEVNRGRSTNKRRH